MTKIYFRSLKAPLGLGIGALAGVLVAMLAWPYMQASLAIKAQMTDALLPPPSSTVDKPPSADADEDPDAYFFEGLESEKPGPQTVQEHFTGYTIAAHIRNETQQYYMVQNEEGTTFTDTQLMSMGLRVYYVSQCELLVISATDGDDKAHIFAPGCTTDRPFGDKPNLEAMPYFQSAKR